MKVDYYRHLAKFKIVADRKEAVENTLDAYKSAQVKLAPCGSVHFSRSVSVRQCSAKNPRSPPLSSAAPTKWTPPQRTHTTLFFAAHCRQNQLLYLRSSLPLKAHTFVAFPKPAERNRHRRDAPASDPELPQPFSPSHKSHSIGIEGILTGVSICSVMIYSLPT